AGVGDSAGGEGDFVAWRSRGKAREACSQRDSGLSWPDVEWLRAWGFDEPGQTAVRFPQRCLKLLSRHGGRSRSVGFWSCCLVLRRKALESRGPTCFL